MQDKVSRIVEKYPAGVFKNRKDHIVLVDHESENPQSITANIGPFQGLLPAGVAVTPVARASSLVR
jgi:nitrogenase molybdenum-iron protein alpha chain